MAIVRLNDANQWIVDDSGYYLLRQWHESYMYFVLVEELVPNILTGESHVSGSNLELIDAITGEAVFIDEIQVFVLEPPLPVVVEIQECRVEKGTYTDGHYADFAAFIAPKILEFLTSESGGVISYYQLFNLFIDQFQTDPAFFEQFGISDPESLNQMCTFPNTLPFLGIELAQLVNRSFTFIAGFLLPMNLGYAAGTTGLSIQSYEFGVVGAITVYVDKVTMCIASDPDKNVNVRMSIDEILDGKSLRFENHASQQVVLGALTKYFLSNCLSDAFEIKESRTRCVGDGDGEDVFWLVVKSMTGSTVKKLKSTPKDESAIASMMSAMASMTEDEKVRFFSAFLSNHTIIENPPRCDGVDDEVVEDI